MKYYQNKLGQNRIDYIVYHNPKAAHQLLYDKGYVPPDQPRALAATIKELVRKEGQQAITALLYIHPDKKAIINALGTARYCTSCKQDSYIDASGECTSCKAAALASEDAFVTDYSLLDTPSLKERYQRLKQKAATDKTDTALSKEVEAAWNVLRLREKADTPSTIINADPDRVIVTQKQLLIFAGIFFTGMLVGRAMGTSKLS